MTPLLFWLHLPVVWGITLFSRAQSCSCPYQERQPWDEKQDPENEPYLSNKLQGLRWTSVSGLWQGNDSAFKSQVLLNSKLKKGRQVYLVSPDGNIITADSCIRRHCSPLSRSSLDSPVSQQGKDGLATQATHADLLAFVSILACHRLNWADLPSAFSTDWVIFPINLNQYTHTVNIPKFKSI